MRADRLLSILMILQIRKKVTAQALALELEVSERTIYRDITALCISGVPVYTERGPGGGISLVDSYKTNLTGLNTNEIRAFFMLSIPSPLTDLGIGRELRAALLKLTAALPDSGRGEEKHVRSRIHLDWVPWFRREEHYPHLNAIHKALWESRTLRIRYLSELPWLSPLEISVQPYGLVAKTGNWYLVSKYEDHLRVFNISKILEAKILDNKFIRQTDFNIVKYWKEWCADYEGRRPRYFVTVRISPKLIPLVSQQYIYRSSKGHNNEIGESDDDGWIKCKLQFETFEEAREKILGYGDAIKVLDRIALRESVRDFAKQIVKFYG